MIGRLIFRSSFLFLFFLWFEPIHAQSAEELATEIQEAVSVGDRDRIKNAIEAFKDLSEIDSLSNHAQYYMAYGWYQLYSFSTDKNEKTMPEYLKRSIKYNRMLIEADDTYQEAYTLLSNSYAIQAHGNFVRKLKYAKRAEKYMKMAGRLDPENPRYMMYKGVGYLLRPKMLGGSSQKALDILESSKELFDSYQTGHPLDPVWGEDELYAWIGQAYEKLKRNDEAKLAYEKSLEINPEYRWVRDLLLPNLNDRLAKG